MRAVSVIVASLLTGLPALGLLPPAPPAAAVAPNHTLAVSGTGVDSYPAYDPAVERYAVTTTAATGGSVTVHATTSDPVGVVRVDGRVAPGGTATVTGLGAGDEVSVLIEDSGGVAVHSLIYLPAGFPALERFASSPAVVPGQIGLTFDDFRGDPVLVAIVDRNGVPAHVEAVAGASDLKQQPDGTITVSSWPPPSGRTGASVSQRDDHWDEVAHYETVGLTNTDSHDSIMLPDGSRWLIAYEHNPSTTLTDAVIQKVSATGTVVFQWSSAALASETVAGVNRDYAHINSIALAPDGDIIASFRHLSAVLKIATSEHDGFAVGDVVWKLGGRDSSFDFVDDPLGGPCAQHAASMLTDGHVLLFDNGSQTSTGEFCVDQSDPFGPTHARAQSRVAEYALDTVAHTATLVWEHRPPGWFTFFMGSAARIGDGHTLIGWAATTQALATEVDADGDLLWGLREAAPDPVTRYLSYRASLMNVPDAIAPSLDVAGPAEGTQVAIGQPLVADFSCTDIGGSSLHSCGGDARPGALLDTSSPGPHTARFTASDGAGNTTTVNRTYTVTATYQPRWTDELVRAQLRRHRMSTEVTVVNDGTYADAFTLSGTAGTSRIRVRYKVGHVDVTHDVRHGVLRTPWLQPGQSFVLRVVALRTRRTVPGAHCTVGVRATSAANASADVVAVRIRARGASAPPAATGRTTSAAAR